MIAQLPPPDRAAFLLDLDGTLLDIAPTPDSVVVAPGLLDHLARLRALCGDALAVVSGRPIAQIEALLGDVPYAIAGEHGTAIRHAPGAAIESLVLAEQPPAWNAEALHLEQRHPGVVLERKRHGFVLHYRAAPEHGAALEHALRAMLVDKPGAFQLMAAKMAWEIRPGAADKGTAVAALMRQPPFAGRVPVFVGDDVTDEDGMRAAEHLGGLGLMVDSVFGDAAGVRAWLAGLVKPAPVWALPGVAA